MVKYAIFILSPPHPTDILFFLFSSILFSLLLPPKHHPRSPITTPFNLVDRSLNSPRDRSLDPLPLCLSPSPDARLGRSPLSSSTGAGPRLPAHLRDLQPSRRPLSHRQLRPELKFEKSNYEKHHQALKSQCFEIQVRREYKENEVSGLVPEDRGSFGTIWCFNGALHSPHWFL